MSEFLTSDVGKVALGGLIAMAAQILVFILGWMKEHRVSIKKRDSDAQYLGIQVVLALDKLVNDCLEAVNDPTRIDSEGYTRSTVENPEFALPAEGDYRALPTQLMYSVMFMPNRVAAINEGLSVSRHFSSPPDYDEYYCFRGEALSKLGLRAIGLIDALCEKYKIPLPEWPESLDPGTAFREAIAKIEAYQTSRVIPNPPVPPYDANR